ncbi:MAG: DUF4080 domain-containing protein [Candidatus Cloacimonetes bacterium]|nr:DUF4080 domain-containing protein [Candidatus Cloacimonadota bacterium]
MKKKILLIGINARWTHSNPALYYLRTYVNDLNYDIQICEYTINQTLIDLISDIYKKNPDIIAFSVYIWNTKTVQNILKDIKKILPECRIILGGPEVSYHPEQWFEKFKIDHIICGNGESGFRELLLQDFDSKMKIIKKANPPFSEIPFPYIDSDKELLKNKYLYYEASRGCIFKCSYCLSSREDQKFSYRKLEQIKSELDFLLDFKPKIIKFVDRTFNANPELARSIWIFLSKKTDLTKFHFEIHPSLLKENDFEILEKIPLGKFQFEIGIQSFNNDTLKEIRRNVDVKKVTTNIKKLIELKNIHIHLDLIAGLPFEDIFTFQNSFDSVYDLKPDQLQLGLLKVLDGTFMKENSEKYSLKYQSESPYMILSNKWLSFGDIVKLHEIEKLLEIYYNSGKFETTLIEIQKLFTSPFEFFNKLRKFVISQQIDTNSMIWIKSAKLLQDFIKKYHNEKLVFFRDCLRWDWCKMAKSHYYPDFLNEHIFKKIKKDNSVRLKELFKQKYPELDSSLVKHAIYFTPISSKFAKEFLQNKTLIVFINFPQKDIEHRKSLFIELDEIHFNLK